MFTWKKLVRFNPIFQLPMQIWDWGFRFPLIAIGIWWMRPHSTGLHIRGMCSDFLRNCKPQLIALISYHKAVPLYKKVRRRLDIGLPWLYTHCQQEPHAGVITFCSSFRLIFHKTYLMADVNVPYPLISGWECLGLEFRIKTHILSF